MKKTYDVHHFHGCHSGIHYSKAHTTGHSRFHHIIKAHTAGRGKFHRILFAVFAAAAVLTILCCVTRYACHVQASSDTVEHKYKYYQNIVLDSQESLDGIAQKYADPAYYRNTREYLNEVIHINHLTVLDGEIQHCTPGTHLIIPYYSDDFLE